MNGWLEAQREETPVLIIAGSGLNNEQSEHTTPNALTQCCPVTMTGHNSHAKLFTQPSSQTSHFNIKKKESSSSMRFSNRECFAF